MADGRPKDPLARYTGPTVVGPLVGANRLFLKSMFDRNFTNQVGTDVGNFISTRLPWLGNQMAKVPTGLVEGVGAGAMKATGVSDFQQAGEEFSKGNYWGALGNTLEGTGYLVATARGLKSIKNPSLLTTDITRTRAVPAVKVFGRTLGGQVIPRKLSIPAAIATAAGSVLTPVTTGLTAMFDGKPAEVPGQPQQQAPLPPMGPVTTGRDGFQYSRNPVTGLNEVVGTTTVDPETGIAYRYNPISGLNEAVGKTTTRGQQYLSWEQDPRNKNAVTDMFPNLSALEEETFRKQLSDLDAETDLLIKELRGGIGSQQAEAQRQIQRVGREGAGSSQDVASQLAELGIDTSPGQLDVRLEQIGQQTAEQQAAQRRSLAQYISGAQSRIGQAERTRAQKETDILLARQAAEDAAREEAYNLDQLIKLLGGS